MEIKKFIHKIEKFRELDNIKQIPYFVYFLQQIKERNGVMQSDIRSCFKKAGIHLSINLSIYFRKNIKKKKGIS